MEAFDFYQHKETGDIVQILGFVGHLVYFTDGKRTTKALFRRKFKKIAPTKAQKILFGRFG